MTQYITPESFNIMVAEFLETQDKDDRDDWYCTSHENAAGVLDALRQYLFRDVIAKAERYEQYLKLRAEFACHGEPGETE